VTSVEETLADPRIARIARELERQPGAVLPPDPTSRHAAVALIMRRDENDDIELLMIRRAAFPSDPWSGHIALPGGRHEPGDNSLEETAIRETREETAIDLSRSARLLGTLDEIHPRTPLLPPLIIRPHVFVVSSNVTITPSQEVAEAFWVPLPLLADPSATGEVTFTDRGVERTERSFRVGDRVVWGLTERVLRQFLRYAMASETPGVDDQR
jgi:8-oxo-dGTP pyrophosphatase MutT (NUDIX family)